MATKNELVHLVDKILLDKVILQAEWDLLVELIHSDGKLEQLEKDQIELELLKREVDKKLNTQ